MEIIGIIPARGGSKRIPRKNLAVIGGMPLIGFTIEAARRSKRLTRVIVSTDDPEIAEVARSFGAEVPFIRPKDLAADLTPDLPVFEHALRFLSEREGAPEMVAHLRVNTGLFRTPEDIDRGIELLLRHPEYDSVRAVVPAPLHPLKTYRLEGKRLLPFLPEEYLSRFGVSEPWNEPVQSLPPVFAAAGYFSALWSKTILAFHSMTGPRILGYEVDPSHALDIDTPEELALARIRFSERAGGKGRS